MTDMSDGDDVMRGLAEHFTFLADEAMREARIQKRLEEVYRNAAAQVRAHHTQWQRWRLDNESEASS